MLLALGDFDGAAHVALRFFQCIGGLCSAYLCGEHDERDGGAIAAGFEGMAGGAVIGTGCTFEDGNRTVDQLLVLGRYVDHQISVDVAEACHGARRDYVEDHLVGCSSLHAGRAGENFGADLGDDGEMCGAFEWGVAVAGEGDGSGAVMAGIGDGGKSERRASAGGDTDDNVVLARPAFGHFGAGRCGVVFTGFVGNGKSFWTSSDEELHGAASDVESGRALGGIEGGDASAGAGADVNQASTLAESGGNEVDGAGNLRQGAADGESDGGVFSVDEVGDLEGGFLIEIGGGWV